MGTFKNPDVWKQNLAYQIGDFVLYNGTVYMAIKPVPAGTAMSADYWYAFDEGAIVPTGEISITENGEVDVAQYATANVNVEGIVPTGEISITENGEVDVTEYATAIVNVEGGGGGDFTTAHVNATGTNFDISDGIFNVCTCVEEGGISATYPSSVGSGHSIEFDVVLYKGAAALMTDPENITATSGAIQQSGEGVYIITGDCTITTA